LAETFIVIFAEKQGNISDKRGFSCKTTPKQAFDELRPWFEGATLYFINNSKLNKINLVERDNYFYIKVRNGTSY